MDTNQEIYDAVERAVLETFPEDGLALHLKEWVVSGHRSEVVDLLLGVLRDAKESDPRASALEILYFICATYGSFKIPGMRDPRPENAQINEPLTSVQLMDLADAALLEQDKTLWDLYCSLFSNFLDFMDIPSDTLARVRLFAARFAAEGSASARTTCGWLEGKLAKLARRS
jgi:hypothetical protein